MPRLIPRRLVSKTYENNIASLSASIFGEPQPKFEPFTHLLVRDNTYLPLEKNKYKRPEHYYPPTYRTKRILEYLNHNNLFVDEAWRYKMRIRRTRYIKGQTKTWSYKIWDLTPEEKILFERNLANKRK